MAVKIDTENHEQKQKNSLLEVLSDSDLSLRLGKISEQSGLSPLNLFQKWILQEEFAIGLARSVKTQAPREEVNTTPEETQKQLPGVQEQNKPEAVNPRPQAQSPEYRKELMKRAEKLKKDGMTPGKIAELFNEEGIPTVSGVGKWYPGSIKWLLNSKP